MATTAQMPDLPIGRLVGAFGIHGELKCDPTDAGRALFLPGATLRLDVDGQSRDVGIAGVREHKGRLLLRIEGCDDATSAQAYVGGVFHAEKAALDVADDEYLDVDLIGCSLEAPDGTPLGHVTAVEHYPASDMLVVGGRMVPLVHSFVRELDIANKRIVMDLPAGILDDSEAL